MGIKIVMMKQAMLSYNQYKIEITTNELQKFYLENKINITTLYHIVKRSIFH